MNRTNLKKYAYLAGLIDGDGCIVISKSYGLNNKTKEKIYDRYILKIDISSSDARLIKYLFGAFGGRYSIANRTQGLSKYPGFCWQPYAKQHKEILNKIFPFIQLKRQQVELALRFCQVHKGHDRKWKRSDNLKRYSEAEKEKFEMMWIGMKKLNQTKIRNLSIVQPQRLSKMTSEFGRCDSPNLEETLVT